MASDTVHDKIRETHKWHTHPKCDDPPISNEPIPSDNSIMLPEYTDWVILNREGFD